MSDKYKNKYRIESNRLKGWNYSNDGHYFITIVTQNRICNLGRVENGIVILSDFGKIVETEWYKSFEIRNELVLENFVIMPNHLHAIIKLNNPDNNFIETHNRYVETHERFVEMHGSASLQNNDNQKPLLFRKPKSISSFIAGFKSIINTKIDDYIDQHYLNIPKYNRNNHFFQPNYYDHIIRDYNEYLRISEYIDNNPINWSKDKFF